MGFSRAFLTGQGAASNFDKSFNQAKDSSFIDKVLTDTIRSNDPGVMQDTIGKILSKVAPENQGKAIEYLQNRFDTITKNQQTQRKRDDYSKVGLNPALSSLDPAAQKEYIKSESIQNRYNSAIQGKVFPGTPSASQPAYTLVDSFQQPGQQQPQQSQQPQQQPQQADSQIPQQDPGKDLQYSDLSDNQVIALQSIPNHSESAKGEMHRRIELDKGIDSSYKMHKDFIDDTTNAYKSFITNTKPKLIQMSRIANKNKLAGPLTAKVLEELNLPISFLGNPDNEAYEKLSLDLLSGLPDNFGSRILKVEVETFLKTIPRLLNSYAGRRVITSNLIKFGEFKEVFYNSMRKVEKEAYESGRKLPRDFSRLVLDRAQPELTQLMTELRSLAEVDHNKVDQAINDGKVLFFDSNGVIRPIPNDPEIMKAAEEKGGKRIW